MCIYTYTESLYYNVSHDLSTVCDDNIIGENLSVNKSKFIRVEQYLVIINIPWQLLGLF